MARAHISLKTKLAAALLQHVRYDEEEAKFVRVISYRESKTLTADQIIARFHLDHGIFHAHDGADQPWNLTWRSVQEHREKTAKIDIPAIAKGKRISRANDESARRLLAKNRGEKPTSRSRIPSRPFQKGHRPLQSRNSFQRVRP